MPTDLHGAAAFSLDGKRIWVAGHRGLVGSAIVRRLEERDCSILTADSHELDLRRQSATFDWVERVRPEVVFLAAAKVGGILANDTAPARFLYDNLMIEANVIEAARRCGVRKLVFLGSSCIYPKFAAQPIREDALLSGPLEPTNEWYAVAKIAGVKLAQAYRRQYGCDFISAMPCNLFGPADNYDLDTSHVIPALIRKAHEAKARGLPSISIWGSGRPRREFLHADDCAEALVHLAEHYSGLEHVNVGAGVDISIYDLAALVCRVVGFEGAIERDLSKPDGTPAKLMDCQKLAALGWRPRRSLEEGLRQAYQSYLREQASHHGRRTGELSCLAEE